MESLYYQRMSSFSLSPSDYDGACISRKAGAGSFFACIGGLGVGNREIDPGEQVDAWKAA